MWSITVCGASPGADCEKSGIGYLRHRLDLQKELITHQAADLDQRARGPVRAEELLPYRVDEGPLRDVAHEDRDLRDVRRLRACRVEDAFQVAEDLARLLDYVAGADDLTGLARGHQPRHVQRVPGDHRIGEMTDRLHQPRHPERSDVRHTSYATSTIISISTEMPSGSELMPTAERAWRPASPNAATSRSDAPLMTFGWSVKSGVQLTMPSNLTTRLTRSRSPISCLRTPRQFRITSSADFRPASTSRSLPNLPT